MSKSIGLDHCPTSSGFSKRPKSNLGDKALVSAEDESKLHLHTDDVTPNVGETFAVSKPNQARKDF